MFCHVMKNTVLILFTVFGISLSAEAYNINPQKITVSGISSGAYMAQQMQIVYANQISGAALIAGGPFNCSEGNVSRALNACMKTSPGAISVDKIVATINDLRKKGLVDSGERISETKVFLISGTKDDVVARPVVEAVKDLYTKLQVPSTNIKFVNNLEVGHAFPTVDFGNPCPTPRTGPFISKCNYDGAFEILNFLYGSLNLTGIEVEANLQFISQAKYFVEKQENSMGNEAVIYVPTACQNGAECALHVSFHGCLQSRDDIGDAYFRKTGFNAWAEANNIIVLYPQAVKNYVQGNPNSCWDWWGYTGAQFNNKQSVQMSVVHKMIEEIIKK